MAYYVERDKPANMKSWTSDGQPIKFKVRPFEGPFSTYLEAKDYILSRKLWGATIWEFGD